MANDNEIKIVIQVATARGKAQIKNFSKSAEKDIDRFSKNSKASVKDLGKSFVKYLGAAAAGAVVVQGFRRMITKGQEFEQQMADLQAITGIAGADLENLGAAALDSSVRWGESASNIIEANKMVASQLATKINFGTAEGIEQLKQVSEQAIVLQKAAGIDLKTAVQATTTAINQFSMPATAAARVINSIAAGSKYGAAEARDQSEAYRKAGSVFAAAGEDLGTLNAATQILAENAIKGSDAGTALLNIMVILQSEAKKLADEGINDVNVQTDGLIASMRKLKPLQRDTAALARIFGRESLTATQILIKNVDTFADMNEKIRGTETAYEQAVIQIDTYKGASARLSAAIDSQLIPAFTESGGVMVSAMQQLTDWIGNVEYAIEVINEWADEYSDFRDQQKMTSTVFAGRIKIFQSEIEKQQEVLDAEKATNEEREKAGKIIEYYNGVLEDEGEQVRKSKQQYKDYIGYLKEQRQAKLDAGISTRKENRAMEELVKNIKEAEITYSELIDREKVFIQVTAEAEQTTKDAKTAQEKAAEAAEELREKIGGSGGLNAQIEELEKQYGAIIDKSGELAEADIKELANIDQKIKKYQNLKRARELAVTQELLDQASKRNEGYEVQAEDVRTGDDFSATELTDPRIKTELELQKAVAKTGEQYRTAAEIALEGSEKTQKSKQAELATQDQITAATIDATAAALARADTAAGAANEFINQMQAQLIAIAIKKGLQSAPFPINIALAAGAAAAAKGLFSLIPEFATGGRPADRVVGAGATGKLYGPGTTTSDSILARLSNREFVVNASSADAMPQLLEATNESPQLAAQFNTVYKQYERAPAYARGGRFSASTATMPPPIPKSRYPNLSTIDRVIAASQYTQGDEGFRLLANKIEDQTRRLESMERRVQFSISEFRDANQRFDIKEQHLGRT